MTKKLSNNDGFFFPKKKQPKARTIKSWKNAHWCCVAYKT